MKSHTPFSVLSGVIIGSFIPGMIYGNPIWFIMFTSSIGAVISIILAIMMAGDKISDAINRQTELLKEEASE